MLHIVKVLITWKRNKSRYLFSYLKYSFKYVFFWKLLHIPLHYETVSGYRLHFFHYSIFLSLFEDMYLNDEYYVKLLRNPVIFDLGSEVGLSVTYFKSIYPTAKITAFEPDPASFKLLSENVKNNNIKNVTLFNSALSDKVGKTFFYIDTDVDGSLTMSLYPKRQKKRINVKVDKLSRYIKQKIDLLKMDIEGSELDVLTDLSNSKKMSSIENMIIEYHHHIDEKVNNLSELLTILENNGFGYQIQAKYNVPFNKQSYQDFLIYAYNE